MRANISKHKASIVFLLAVFSLSIGLLHAESTPTTTATSTADVQAQIDNRNDQIKQLESQIDQYNTEVDNASKQGQTLQSTLNTLDLTKKKITTDLTLTTTKIDKTNLTIEQTGDQISSAQTQIALNKKAIASALQEAQSQEDIGLFQLILSSKNISDVWSEIDSTRQIEDVIASKSKELIALQNDMQTKQVSLQGQKKSLTSLKQDLSGQAQVVAQTAQEKAALLAQTKDKEQTYQTLLTQTQQQKDQFEKDLDSFEAQLNIPINTSSYPAPQHGILSWPLQNAPTQSPCDSAHKIVSCIVRGFSRPVIKNGVVTDAGHNGVDFRARTGTRVGAVLGGVVAGTGNTDVYAGCYGLGRWVMVNHDNGLSSIYMHLSVISVKTGQRVETGDLIGYSGYSGSVDPPGPNGAHLHVTIYATEGVKIQKFTSSIGCKQAVVPLADPKAYLDPMTYFPTL